MTEDGLSDADIACVRANYRSLADVSCEHGDRLEDVQALVRERRLPGPSYVLPDGTLRSVSPETIVSGSRGR